MTGRAFRHHSERHSERVHGPQHLHLSARTFACGSYPTSSTIRRDEMPKFNSISISGYHMQEAGANLVQELAFTLADGQGIRPHRRWRGHGRGRLRRPSSFFFCIGMNFFMEAAKLRAARSCWHRIMDEFAPKNEILDAADPLSDHRRAACRNRIPTTTYPHGL